MRKFTRTIITSQYYQWMFVAIALLFIVALFWLPFGFKTTATQIGWGFLNSADENGWRYLSIGRPMVMLPWEVAAFISSDSFLGVQLVLITIFLGKAIFLYMILDQLGVTDRVTAFFVAVVFTIYPADTGLFVTHAIGRYSAVFFHLLAVLLLVLACKHEKNIYLVLMIIAHTISAFTAEAGALLALATPALVLLFPQCSKHKKIMIAAAWYLILALSILFIVFTGAEYQAMRFEQGFTEGDFLINVIESNIRALWRGFFYGWWEAILSLKSAISYLPYSIATILLMTCGIWVIKCFPDNSEYGRINVSSHFWGLLAGGVIIFGLSFFPYSITDLRYYSLRVYYYAAIGSALFWGVLLRGITDRLGKRKDVVFILISAVLVFFAASNGLVQHAKVVAVSRKQQQVLALLVEQAPILQSSTVFVILADSPENSLFSHDVIFSRALNWIYNTKDFTNKGFFCYYDRNNCNFSDSSIQFESAKSSSSELNGEYTYDQVLIFSYIEDDEIILLREIPAELLAGFRSTVGYEPFERITYIPFPKRPQKAFVAGLNPDPIRLAPQGWSGSGLTLNDRRVCDVAQHGQCALHFLGSDQSPSPVFHQQIEVYGNAGQNIEFSLWQRMELDPQEGEWPRANVKIYHTDGTTSDHIIILDEASSKWHLSVTNIKTAKSFRKVLLSLEGGNGVGSVWIDKVELFIDSLPISIRNNSFEE